MKRLAAMTALLATMAALMTAPSLAFSIAPSGVAPTRDAADPSMSTEVEAPAITDTPTAPPEVELAQPSAPQAVASAEPPAPAIAPDPLVTQPTARAVAEAPATAPPAETAAASTDPEPASRDVGGGQMPIDPVALAGAIGLLVGIVLAAAWSIAMRRAPVARVREAAEAQSRASLAVRERTLRRARSRSSHDLIVDAPSRANAPDRR